MIAQARTELWKSKVSIEYKSIRTKKTEINGAQNCLLNSGRGTDQIQAWEQCTLRFHWDIDGPKIVHRWTMISSGQSDVTCIVACKSECMSWYAECVPSHKEIDKVYPRLPRNQDYWKVSVSSRNEGSESKGLSVDPPSVVMCWVCSHPVYSDQSTLRMRLVGTRMDSQMRPKHSKNTDLLSFVMHSKQIVMR